MIYTVVATDGRVFYVEGKNVKDVIKKCTAITVQYIYTKDGERVYEY